MRCEQNFKPAWSRTPAPAILAGMKSSTRNRHVVAVLGVLLLLGAVRSGAQSDVVVTKAAGDRAAIDFAGFTAGGANGALFLQVLKNDLYRSGWFQVTPTAGEYSVRGSFTESGGRIEVQASVLKAPGAASVLSRKWPGGRADVRMLAHKVSDDLVKALTGKEGFAQSRLALVGTRTGRKELYLADSDGANLTQLTRDRSISLFPRWSPDNRSLVYTSYVNRFPDILRIDLASGARRKLAAFRGLNTGGAFSPDGRQVAMVLSKDGNPELYVMNLADSSLTRLTRTPQANESSPSWSPDGRQIVFVSDAAGVSRPQLYIIDRAGGAPRRVTSRGPQNVSPDWGPDGRIAFSSIAGREYALCVLDPRTLEVTTIAHDASSYEEPSWARDGRNIACQRTIRYQSGICLIDSVHKEKVMLLDEGGDWYSPAWQK